MGARLDEEEWPERLRLQGSHPHGLRHPADRGMGRDTGAEGHGSEVLEAMLRPPGEGDVELHADSAYRSEEQEGRLNKAGRVSRIHAKWARNHLLAEEQKASRREKSRARRHMCRSA